MTVVFQIHAITIFLGELLDIVVAIHQEESLRRGNVGMTTRFVLRHRIDDGVQTWSLIVDMELLLVVGTQEIKSLVAIDVLAVVGIDEDVLECHAIKIFAEIAVFDNTNRILSRVLNADAHCYFGIVSVVYGQNFYFLSLESEKRNYR